MVGPLDWNYGQINEWPEKHYAIQAVTKRLLWVSVVAVFTFGAVLTYPCGCPP